MAKIKQRVRKGYRGIKRKFYGNTFTGRINSENSEEPFTTALNDLATTSSFNTTTSNISMKHSVSFNKVAEISLPLESTPKPSEDNAPTGYRMIDTDILCNIISSLSCQDCGNSTKAR